MKMKTTRSLCCGSYKIRNTRVEHEIIPDNPKIIRGTALIFLGAGAVKLSGKETGTFYYASDHRRHFNVFPEDADGLLKRPDIILQRR